MPKAKPIGTPIATQAATITTKNTNRLPKPIAISSPGEPQPRGDPADHRDARVNPATSWFSIKRSSAMIAARLMPNRIATAR